MAISVKKKVKNGKTKIVVDGKKKVDYAKPSTLKPKSKKLVESIVEEDIEIESDPDEEVPELGDENDSIGEVDEDESDLDDDEVVGENVSEHKHDLEKIKQSDPEFYKFLQEQDADLLEFNESDISDEDEEQDELQGSEETAVEEVDEKGEKPLKKPKLKTDATGRQVFDRNWYLYLEESFARASEDNVPVRTVRLAISAFTACVARTGADIEPPQWIVNDNQVFDAIVRLCFGNLGSALYGLLGEMKEMKEEDIPDHEEEENEDEEEAFELPDQKKKKNKLRAGKLMFEHWKSHSGLAKDYLTGLLMFVNEVQSQAVVVATMKTIATLVPLFLQFTKTCKQLIKSLVRVWTRKTMDCRCLAYIVLNKIVVKDSELFPLVYKSMYMGFVSNARQVTSETWPLLQFMQRTFAEITLVKPDVAYQYAFIYIRQTAIHIRNAKIGKQRKDLVQTVYNWQLMQCFYLWSRVVAKAHGVEGAESICELSYPLTQVVVATLKLFPSLRYLPLRFHCLSILIQLQVNCSVYVNSLALGCELLEDIQTLIKKKPKSGKGSIKQVDMDSSIKATSQHLEDAGWRQTAVDWLFRMMLQSAHVISSQVAFPDIVLPIIYKLRVFGKECRNGDYARLFKALLDKLVEHSKYVTDKIRLRGVDLNDDLSMMTSKHILNDPNSPISKYYSQFTKIWKLKAAALQRSDSVKKQPKPEKQKKEDKTNKKAKIEKEEIASDAIEDDVKPTVKSKKKKMKSVKNVKPDATIVDKVTDLSNMDWSDDE